MLPKKYDKEVVAKLKNIMRQNILEISHVFLLAPGFVTECPPFQE